MFVAERPRALLLSPVGTPCFVRHAAPTELEEEFGASVLQTCRSYGTFKELFDLLILSLCFIVHIEYRQYRKSHTAPSPLVSCPHCFLSCFSCFWDCFTDRVCVLKRFL